MLGAQLRRLREEKRISREAAGEVVRGSPAKISRIELGRVAVKQRDVGDLLTLYGVTDEQSRTAFLDLARQSNAPGWWQEHDGIVPDWFEMYLGLEQACSGIRTYEPQLVPGLLQTEDYARAVLRLGQPGAPAERIEHQVGLRIRRQDVLTRPGAPNLRAVIDEAALRRLVDRTMVRAQIQHLIELAELPNIVLQVLPFHSGVHPAAGGPFTILRFSETDLPDIVYLEQLDSSLYLDKRQDIDGYQVVMDRLSVQAESATHTMEFLNELRKES